MMKFSAIAFAASLMAASSAQAVIPFTVTLESEAPGAQNSSAGFTAVGVETFDSIGIGTSLDFISDFGGSSFTGRYSGVQVMGADQYGGAGGGGRYAVTFSNAGYSIDLSTSLAGGVTYFGFWLSALDAGNQVQFYQANDLLFTFSANDARDFIAGLPGAASYRCNPNPAFANRNCAEPYSFLNFYARGGTRFDRVVFTQTKGGGYESDNHTVGQWNRLSGTIVPVDGAFNAVPEPATWALLVLGFGLVGAGMRRRPMVVTT
ncbi:Npun_F0296 family exosortase-dependent surface protein [Sandarakinorhabdus sp.]|uniref:Npun_F0296 family exosortase-dependent surface protein n=1 Tax=Sandarakinorhabdus sp. TaxID=1916663 RepID=UPI003F6F73AD